MNIPRAALLLLLVPVLLLPLFVVDVPPLLDYPNHLARVYILENRAADPLLAARYKTTFRLQPNLAMDVAVPLLSRAMPFRAAGSTFLGLVLLLPLFGVLLIHRALFGESLYWPLLAAFLLYHGLFLAGFLNFCLGVGLFLCGFGLWISMERRPVWIRIGVAALIAIALYFTHLIALLFFGVAVMGTAFIRPTWRGVVLAGLPFVFPFVLALGWMADDSTGGARVAWSWLGKLRMPVLPFMNYLPVLDIACAVLFFGGIAWGLLTRRLRVDRRVVPVLVVLLLFAVFGPAETVGGAFVDVRFPIALAFLLVAGTRLTPVPEPERRFRSIAIVCVCLFLVRTGIVTASWWAHRSDLRDVEQAIEVIEEGAVLSVAFPDDAARTYWKQGPTRRFVFLTWPALTHVPCVAVEQKSAFCPYLLTNPRQQPVGPTPAYAPFDPGVAGPVSIERTSRAPMPAPHYVMVLYAGYEAGAGRTPPEGLTLIHESGIVRLYRVTPAR